jgi:hypothetical protein
MPANATITLRQKVQRGVKTAFRHFLQSVRGERRKSVRKLELRAQPGGESGGGGGGAAGGVGWGEERESEREHK